MGDNQPQSETSTTKSAGEYRVSNWITMGLIFSLVFVLGILMSSHLGNGDFNSQTKILPPICGETPGGIKYCYPAPNPNNGFDTFREVEFRIELAPVGATFSSEQFGKDPVQPLIYAVSHINGVKRVSIDQRYHMWIDISSTFSWEEIMPRVLKAVDDWKAANQPILPTPEQQEAPPIRHEPAYYPPNT